VKTWYLYALMTILMWGVWGVFSKFASAHSKPRQVLIFQSVGVLAFALVVLCVERFRIEWSVPGFSWSVAAWVLYLYWLPDVLRRIGTGEGVHRGHALGVVPGGDHPAQRDFYA